VNEEDYKSPLPPRRPNLDQSLGENEEVKPVEVVEMPKVSSETTVEKEEVVAGVKPKINLPIKKFLIVGGILAILGLLIFKIILPRLGGRTNVPVTLNYWGLWEDTGIMQGVIDEFETKNPNIKINYVVNQKNDYRTRLIGRLAKTGTDNSVPDIYRIHSSWLPMFDDYLASVPTSSVKTIQLDTDYYDVYKKDLMVKGSFKAVPLMFDSLMLFYNKDLLDAAGKDLPKSWVGLEATAKELTVTNENGGIEVAGVAMGTTENVDHWSDILGLMMQQNGVSWTANEAQDKEKIQSILKFYTLFLTQDHVWDNTLPSSTELFANGKLVFYFAPSWRIFNIGEMNPNLNFGLAPVPQLPTLANVALDKVESGEEDGALTNRHWATYWVEAVNSKSKNQQEAWKFMEFLTSKESMEKLFTTASQVRSFGEIYPRKSMAASLNSNLKVKPFLDVANFAQSGYMSSRTFDDGLNDLGMIKYFEDAINGIVNENKTAETVVETVILGMQQTANKYKLGK
jgi:multiple sugar transport system substrate-binding protein